MESCSMAVVKQAQKQAVIKAPCTQVGSELELVSRDERELVQSRAELAALLTQQRSVQAATVQSPPSTSDAQDSMQVLSKRSSLPYKVSICHTVLHHVSSGRCQCVDHVHPRFSTREDFLCQAISLLS